MRATVLHGAGDVRIESVPDARLIEPGDALLVVTHACICGSDLWPYNLMQPGEAGRPMGHEAIGVVEDVGKSVRTLKAGDVVVMPFAYSDGTCVFCREGLHTSCLSGGFFGSEEVGGAQAEAAVGRVGVPHYEAIPAAEPAFYGNVTVGGGPAPVRAYIQELLPDVLEGRIEPGRVFDRILGLEEVPDGYRAMNAREAIKVMVKPS